MQALQDNMRRLATVDLAGTEEEEQETTRVQTQETARTPTAQPPPIVNQVDKAAIRMEISKNAWKTNKAKKVLLMEKYGEDEITHPMV